MILLAGFNNLPEICNRQSTTNGVGKDYEKKEKEFKKDVRTSDQGD